MPESKPHSAPDSVPLTDAEKKSLRERAHIHFMSNLDKMSRNPYAYGGRGSVLESDLVRAAQYEQAKRRSLEEQLEAAQQAKSEADDLFEEIERERDEWRRRAENASVDVAHDRAEYAERALQRGMEDGETEEIRAWCALNVAALKENAEMLREAGDSRYSEMNSEQTTCGSCGLITTGRIYGCPRESCPLTVVV